MIPLLDRAQLNVRRATRGLWRDARISFAVVLSLGLGIGANATALGILQRLWHVAPPGIHDATMLRRIYGETRESSGKRASSSVFDFAAFSTIATKTGAFRQIAAYAPSTGTLGRGEYAAHVNLEYVAGDLFGTLEARPMIGRIDSSLFGMQMQPAVSSIAISYGLWKAAFGGATDIVGKTVVVDDRSYVVAAVMPRGFSGPELTRTDVWLPAAAIGPRLSPTWATDWDAPWLFIVARLRPGENDVASGVAATEALRAAYAGSDKAAARIRVWLGPLWLGLTGERPVTITTSVWVYALAATLLVIACLNAANLLMLRATNRAHELFVRRAMGATGVDVLALFVSEAQVLALVSALAAVAFAALLDTFVTRLLLPNLDWTAPLLTGPVLGFTAAAAAVIGFVIALAPVIAFARGELQSSPRFVAQRTTPRQGRIRSALVSLQAGLAVVLLVGAGVFVRSLSHANAIGYGVAADQLSVVSVSWPRIAAATSDTAHLEWHRRVALLQAVAHAVVANPQTASASVSMGGPFRSSERTQVRRAGDAQPLELRAAPSFYAVDGRYFGTVQTPILRGRAIEESDNASSPRVAVVSETMARELWPGGNALSQCLILGTELSDCVRVVGIAADIREARGRARSQFYLPLAQTPAFGNTFLYVRRPAGASGSAQAIRRAFLSLDPAVEYVDVRPMRAFIDPAFESLRLSAVMFGVISVLALAIAVSGLYATVAYAMSRRVRELGLRQALGATPRGIAALICIASLRATVPGALLGLGVAAMLTRYAQALLYDTRALDPMMFASVAVLLIFLGILAVIPVALRVLRASPAEALRVE